eukprot:scaffold13340_cov71-Phaeocystis_antarctica.AAC.4
MTAVPTWQWWRPVAHPAATLTNHCRCQRAWPPPTASGTSGEPPACSQANPPQSSRSSNPRSERE